MATVRVVDIIDRCQTILQDTTGTRWSKHELLRYVNDAQREVVLMRPDAYSVNTSFTCAADSKQALPAAALRLIDVVRNVGGDVVRIIKKRVLDDQLPNWHNTPVAGATAVQHYVYNPLDPKSFYLYPKPQATVQIEIVYSSAPDSIVTAETDPNVLTDIAATTITLDDIYANAVLDYTLYRAYSKDADYAGNGSRAMSHYQAFQNSLGIKTQADAASSPQAPDQVNDA